MMIEKSEFCTAVMVGPAMLLKSLIVAHTHTNFFFKVKDRTNSKITNYKT